MMLCRLRLLLLPCLSEAAAPWASSKDGRRSPTPLANAAVFAALPRRSACGGGRGKISSAAAVLERWFPRPSKFPGPAEVAILGRFVRGGTFVFLYCLLCRLATSRRDPAAPEEKRPENLPTENACFRLRASSSPNSNARA